MTFLNIVQMGWMPHPAIVLIEAAAISAALALVTRGPLRERIYYGTYVLSSFGAATLAGGWLMHWIHG